MTTYRDRLIAGEHDAKKLEKMVASGGLIGPVLEPRYEKVVTAAKAKPKARKA